MPIIPLTLRLVKGSKLTFSELDNNFIRLRDAINSKTDFYVTGGIYNPSTMSLDFTGNKGFTPFNVDVSSLTDTYVSGGVYDPNTGCVTFSTTSGYTFDVCGFVTGNTLEQVLVNGNDTGTNWIETENNYGIRGNYYGLGFSDNITFNTGNVRINSSDFTYGSYIETAPDIITIFSDSEFLVTGGGLYEGIKYTADYSSNFVNRSLVDKEYVDREISGNTYWTSGSSGNYSIKVINDTTTDATGNYAVAEGFNTLASGESSHSEGENTIAIGNYGSHAEGYFTTASGDSSHTEGYYATAIGDASHAEGGHPLNGDKGGTSIGVGSHAEGVNTTASGDTSHAEGYGSVAGGEGSHAEGGELGKGYIGGTALGIASHAEGVRTIASGVYSHAEGERTTASGDESHAEGSGTIASGSRSHAEGSGTIASGITSHAEGYNTIASGYVSHAEGEETVASGASSHAEGYLTTTIGDASHAEGQESKSYGQGSHAEGYRSRSYGNFSHAEGENTTASGESSHSEGKYTTALGSSSHAEGLGTTASGGLSHAEGNLTIASGYTSHAEGFRTTAIGDGSHAEGSITTASGITSHAEGSETSANGYASHAEGSETSAIGDYSHSQGRLTMAIGISSHAEGIDTKAIGDYSHSQGDRTTSFGNYSHAGGVRTFASGETSFIHSANSIVTGDRSVVLGGQFITGTTDDTVYVPYLNIRDLATGTSVNSLGIDSNGNVVPSITDNITITRAEGLTLISNSGLTPTADYYISDSKIWIKAIDNHSFSRNAIKSQQIVKSTAYTGTGCLGVWTSSLTPIIGDKVIWGGRLWSNLTGNVGSSVDYTSLDTTNWSLLTSDSLYEDKLFFIIYDFVNNNISSQYDDRNNVIMPKAEYITDGYLYTDWGDTRISNNICTIITNNIPLGLIVNNECLKEGITGNIDVDIYDNECGTIRNNSGGGEIVDNIVLNVIENNVVGGFIVGNYSNYIGYNQVSGSISSNKVVEILRNTASVIQTNEGVSILDNNISATISYNRNFQLIDNNTNLGNIRGNDCNIIRNNTNNGDIRVNQCISIVNNSNNGSIDRNDVSDNIDSNSNDGFILFNRCYRIYQNSNIGNIESNVTQSIDSNTYNGDCSFNLADGNIDNLTIDSTGSMIFGGTGNTINNKTNVQVFSRYDFSPTDDNKTYIESLNINTLGTGTSVNSLGIDVDGNVVVGTSGSTSVDTFTTGGTYDNSTALLSFTKNDSTTYDVDMSDLPLIDDVTIEVDGNNEIRLKDFVGSPTGGTRTFDGQIVITSGLTLSTLGTGTSINNLGIDVNGNVVVGTTGSTGVSGSGTNNYVARWTPDGSILGNSTIQDNGTTIGIGTGPNPNSPLVLTSNLQFGSQFTNNSTSVGVKSGIIVISNGVSSGINCGATTSAQNSTTQNIGLSSIATSSGSVNALGGEFVANGTTTGNKYSVRLSDGTEDTGKILMSMDINGNANWANITYSDISGTVPFTGNTSGDCISDLYVSNIHSCSPLNINPNNEGNVTIGQNSLIVDTTNDRIGIGKTSPTVSLDVSGNTRLDGNVTVTNNLIVEGTNTINTIKRQTYTFTTTNATPYIQPIATGGNVYGRYIKAIVIGNSNVGSLGGEFVKFYDYNGFAPSTTQLSSTGTLAENIVTGTPAFSISDIAEFTATGVAGTTIDWKVILEYSDI